MNKYKISIQGMTCTGCEEHVAVALENIGAKNIEASFRRGEAVFELPDDIGVESAKKAINEAKYQKNGPRIDLKVSKLPPGARIWPGNNFWRSL